MSTPTLTGVKASPAVYFFLSTFLGFEFAGEAIGFAYAKRKGRADVGELASQKA